MAVPMLFKIIVDCLLAGLMHEHSSQIFNNIRWEGDRTSSKGNSKRISPRTGWKGSMKTIPAVDDLNERYGYWRYPGKAQGKGLKEALEGKARDNTSGSNNSATQTAFAAKRHTIGDCLVGHLSIQLFPTDELSQNQVYRLIAIYILPQKNILVHLNRTIPLIAGPGLQIFSRKFAITCDGAAGK
ncbi:hypothetical protein B0H17DRAFT_1136034 [Mycena rosella]|uniref:Uncharacterized protein n=1 Tax=Mycena rosella TaxID=1033263 RepID=A0AAD7DC59_MYCRO|nr:hypothetical protein B0H17DRAFT_1136034 [Mycena rosella]